MLKNGTEVKFVALLVVAQKRKGLKQMRSHQRNPTCPTSQIRWQDEHLRIYGTQLEQKVHQNSLKIVSPQQVGGTDCGIFVLSAAEYAIKGFSIDQFDYSHKAMEFIRTKIAINLLNADISDNDDIDQDDHHVDFVNHLSDISDDEIDEESNSSGSDDETREEISSMIV